MSERKAPRYSTKAQRGDGDLLARLAAFAKWAVAESIWRGGDLDGGSVEDKALELGLIVSVAYDPAVHGESEYGAEPGDEWYVFADDLKAAPPPPQEAE